MAKKIVILGPAHPLRGGGITTFNERLAYELISMGHDVTIFSFSLQYPNFLFPGKTQYSSDPAPEGLNIKTRLNSINPINWWIVGNEIKELKPDELIVRFWLPFMGPSLGTVLRRVKTNNHTRIISIVDNIIPHEKRIGDKLFSSYFVKPVDRFVVMSRSVKEDLKSFISGNKPVEYVPHPVYDNYGKLLDKKTAREFLKLNPDEKYILFFGFIRKYKGLDLLYKAMGDPRIKSKKIRLIVAGEYYVDKDYYTDIIKEKDISNVLELHTDFIPNESVKYYFCAADLVVQPYKTATQSGISQLAYHFEKPMLVTNVGGLPEIVNHGEAGYVVDVDENKIADAIIDFYENNREDRFVEQVKENKKRFSWTNLIKGLFGE